MVRATTAGGNLRVTAGALARIAAIFLCLAAGAGDAGAAQGPGPADAASPGPAPGPTAAPAGVAPPSSAGGPAAAKTAAASFRNDYALLLGIQYWDRLDDFDPAIPPGATGRAGRFEPAGINAEVSYHRRVSHWLGWDVLLGGIGGLFYHANKENYDVTILPSGTRIEGELSARGFYVMPSVKLFSGEPRPWRFSLGAGVGLVYVDVVNSLEDGMTVDTYFREEALGGFVSAGVDRMLRPASMSILLRLEAKALFADFGSLGAFAPETNLTGPVFLLQAGVAVAD